MGSVNSINKLNPYLKFIVSLIAPLSTALGAEYGHTTWYPFVAACIASALVYLAPNTPATPTPAAVPVKIVNHPVVVPPASGGAVATAPGGGGGGGPAVTNTGEFDG